MWHVDIYLCVNSKSVCCSLRLAPTMIIITLVIPLTSTPLCDCLIRAAAIGHLPKMPWMQRSWMWDLVGSSYECVTRCGQASCKDGFKDGMPKGTKQVLEERSINTTHMVAEDLRTVLSWHNDFRNEKTIVEHYLNGRGHLVMFVPNFIANLIPLSEFGDKRKCTAASSKYSNFTLARLCQNVGPALDSISTDLIRKYFRKV